MSRVKRYILLTFSVLFSLLSAIILQSPLKAQAASASIAWAQQTSLGSGTSADFTPQIVRDSSGNIYALSSALQSTGYRELGLVKYDPAGNVLWVQTYSEANLHDINMGLALDGAQNVYVEADSARFGANYLTLKYSPAGVLQWSEKYTDNNPESRPHPIGDTMPFAVDTAGNSYVSGFNATGSVLIKYDANGSLIWERSEGDCQTTSGCNALVDVL